MYRGVREMLLLLDGAVSDAVMSHRFIGQKGVRREQGIDVANSAVFNVMISLIENSLSGRRIIICDVLAA